MDSSSIQVARYILGLSWIYHGVVPKLLTIAPLEKQLTATLGFSNEISTLITKFAGVSEIIFGLILIAYYKNKNVVLLNMIALILLLIFVAINMPTLLIEAFNPVTTNLALIGLSYMLFKHKYT